MSAMRLSFASAAALAVAVALLLAAPAALGAAPQQQRPGARGPATALPMPAEARPLARSLKAEAAPPVAHRDRCAPGAAPAADGTCACADGWRGRDCMACSSSGEAGVCPAFTGQAGSVCDANMTYSNTTAYKAYDCDLVGGLSKWVTGVAAFCNTRGERVPFTDSVIGLQPGGLAVGGRAPGSPANRFCKLEVGLVQQPGDPLLCLASDCDFLEGSPNFRCRTTQCDCGGRVACPPLIQSVVANLANSTIGLTCAGANATDGRCILEGVQPRFTLQCRAGECTQPREAARALAGGGPAEAEPPRAFPRIALISTLPTVLLLAFGALFTSYVVAARALFKAGAKASPPPPPEAGGGGGGGGDAKVPGVTLLAPQPSIALRVGDPDPTTAFVFDRIVCSVPDPAAARGGARRGLRRLLPGGRRGAAAPPVCAHVVAGAKRGLAPAPSVDAEDGRPGAAAAARGASAAAAAASGRKVLLHGVSGVVDQGEVLGVMGPSGSGKSTLLSILSGAAESVGAGARVEGAVSLGGERRRGVLRKATAFVPQKDVLLPALTVEECVRYSALLRLPRTLSAGETQERIDGVLSELGLSHVARSLVGGSASIRGVSGGERRRVTIAMALVTRPRLVIMDEPTSGLDSYTAYNLMRTAQEIAMHDRVVIMSLHQPSPDMFDSLSQVLLIAQGRAAYLGAPSGVSPHFAAAGLPIPRKRQPAEHMLHVASQPAGLSALLAYADRCADARKRIAAASPGPSPSGRGGGGGDARAANDVAVAAAVAAAAAATAAGPFAAAGAAPTFLVNVHGGGSDGTGAPPAGAAEGVRPATPSPKPAGAAASEVSDAEGRARGAPLRRWAGGKARECAVLYWRAFTNMRREPRLLMLHLLVALVLGLVVGAVFFQLENSQVGVQNRLGSMFFALALFGWTSVSVVDGLVLERELVEREVVGHYYKGGTYLLASLVLDGLLLRTLPALIFSALVYPMVGLLPEVSRVVTFMFVLATYTCTVGALTTALTALCRTSSATTLAMNIILLMWVLVGGYLVNPMSIPAWLRWVRCLSPMSFAFEVLAANEMADQYYALRVAGFAQLDGIKGDVFLRTLGLSPSTALESTVALVVFYLGSVALAFGATTYTLWRNGGGSFGRLLGRRRRE